MRGTTGSRKMVFRTRLTTTLMSVVVYCTCSVSIIRTCPELRESAALRVLRRADLAGVRSPTLCRDDAQPSLAGRPECGAHSALVESRRRRRALGQLLTASGRSSVSSRTNVRAVGLSCMRPVSPLPSPLLISSLNPLLLSPRLSPRLPCPLSCYYYGLYCVIDTASWMKEYIAIEKKKVHIGTQLRGLRSRRRTMSTAWPCVGEATAAAGTPGRRGRTASRG